MAKDMEWFSEFPEADDEEVNEWLRNAGPFLTYNANVGYALCAEIKRREKMMEINILCILREIRGKEWERPK